MSRTVVVVDDEPDIRELARISMERIGGHRVLVARDGAEAVELVREHRPDAVLMDVQMPGMTGPQTVLALRDTEEGADVPVILLTASVLEAQLTQLRALDVAEVLTKPFDPLTLPAVVARVLGWEQ